MIADRRLEPRDHRGLPGRERLVRRALLARVVAAAVDLVAVLPNDVLRLPSQEGRLGLVHGCDAKLPVDDDEPVGDPVEDGLELALAPEDVALLALEPPPAPGEDERRDARSDGREGERPEHGAERTGRASERHPALSPALG